MADPLTSPLDVIDELFRQHAASSNPPGAQWGERQHLVKALGLEDEQAFARIPCLNDQVSADTVRPFSLVRYRALVQDIFEPEIYISCLQEVEAAGGAARLVTTKYRERLDPRPGCELRDIGQEALGQRGACYCVPIPGETAWAAQASASRGPAPTAASPAVAGRAKKRAQPDEDVDMAMGDVPPVPEGAPPPVRRSRVAGAPAPAHGTGGGVDGDAFGLNLPLPWEERRGHGASTACIVKLYDGDAEALRICETVEILGVLCINPEMANLGGEVDPMFGGDARHPSTALVPRLHAVLVRKLPFYHPMLPYTPDWLSEARLAAAYQAQFSSPDAVAAARAAAVAQLTRGLGGDAVAAEYVLMLLVSRSFAKHGDKSLGCWSLNLARWPQDLQVAELGRAAAELAPRVVQLELNSKSLNERKWRPTKDFEANRLVAGQLQLAPGTLLVVDETSLAEGQVGVHGLKALAAITGVVTDQVLSCDFQVQDVNVPLELSCIMVSQGKSIIKGVDALLPVRCAPSPALPQDAVPLDAVRLLLGLVTRTAKAMNIPDDVAKQISTDFAEVRRKLEVPAELIHLWMGMARGYCLGFCENDLTVARWRAVLQLEQQRLRRIEESGLSVR